MDLLEARTMRELYARQAIFRVDTGDLARKLAKHFSIEEIDLLGYDIGIDHEEIKGDVKSERAMNLIEYCERRGILYQLILQAQEQRSNVDWPLLPKG